MYTPVRSDLLDDGTPMYSPQSPVDGPPQAPSQAPFDSPPMPRQSISARREQPRRRARWYIWLVGGCLGTLFLGVLGCALVMGMLGGLIYITSHQQQADATTSRTFVVGEAPSLVVDDTAGTVVVTTGATSQISVRATRHARAASLDEAKREVQAMAVQMSQSGDAISVSARTDQATRLPGVGSHRQIDLTITVPEHTRLHLRLESGQLQVRGVAAPIVAHVMAGEAQLSAVQFTEQSSVQVGAGTAQISGALAEAATLTVQVSTGSVEMRLPAKAATHLDLVSDEGKVAVEGWPVRVRESGAGASVRDDSAPQPTRTLAIHVGAGTIHVVATSAT